MSTAELISGESCERVGRYELLRLLAVGGMAEIYLARVRGPEGFEKLVVVKRMLPQHTTHPQLVAMFMDEARILGRLRHPNVVQVFDAGVDHGDYFFAMEFLHGVDVRTLARRLAGTRRVLPVDHALRIVLDVCAALQCAHEQGVVHRDVSPHNVFVTFDGGVKLVDFGIARASQRQPVTFVGPLQGKIRYMSPEQARRQPVDHRSDVFSLGILLWELTTGRKLFDALTEYEILQAIAERDAPPPSRVAPRYPAELEAIVMKALRRRPEDRFQTARDLQAALELFTKRIGLRASSSALGRFMSNSFPDRIGGARSYDIPPTRRVRKIREPRPQARSWKLLGALGLW